MSITIDQSFVEQFSANVHMLAEQRMSRLRNSVRTESVTGESWAIERLGNVDAPNKITNRHGDTPLDDTPHSRRWGFLSDFDAADLIDKQDQVRLLIDPAGPYTRKHAGRMGRGVDDSIIDALGGDVKEGKNAGTTVSFLSGQTVAHGSTGLTIQKLIEAKEKLDAAEVDEFIPRFFATNAKGIRNLLEDDKISSADFNTVKALVRGEINEYMGFTFLRTERLPVASNIRDNFAYAMDGIVLGFGQEPVSIAAQRPDKRHSLQIYTYGTWGATRIEDAMVVKVEVDES